MYKSGFAYTGNINQNVYGWSTSGNACFYVDENDFCKTNSLKQFRHEYSYGISSSTSGKACIYKTINVSPSTHYVLNVMVKSTFVKSETADKIIPILPVYAEAVVGSLTHQSLDVVGISDDWVEMSLCFDTKATTTTVTIRIGVDFSGINQTESVLFSEIRIDKLQTKKILFLAYETARPDPFSSVTFEYDNIPDDWTIADRLHAMRTEFEDVWNLVCNGKVPLEIDEQVLGELNNLNGDSTDYTVGLDNVVANSQSDASLIANYDCIFCNVPIGGKPYASVFSGPYTVIGQNCTNADAYELDGKKGFIWLTKGYIDGYTKNAQNNMDGEIHEFVHYIQACASRLDKMPRKYSPHIDDLVHGTKDIYGNNVTFYRNGTAYTAYQPFYDYLKNHTSGEYDYLFEPFESYPNSYRWKYRWYYDILNASVQDCYRYAGTWGMLSNWVEIGCTEMTYHMKKSLGIKQGVYHVINNQSNQYLDSTLNESGYPKQNNKTCLINQYWDFRPAGNGTYEIVPLATSDKRLTAKDSGAVTLSPASGATTQKWKVIRATDTTFTIISVAHNTYLSRASTSADYVALTSTLSATSYWRFSNVNAIENSINKLINSNSNKLASVTTNGSYTITQQTYAYNLNQMWQAKLLPDGYFQLIPLHSQSLCLTATSSGEQVAVQTNSKTDAQKWLIVADSVSGNYRIHSKAYPTKMLSVASPNTGDGVGIKLVTYNTSLRVKWNVESLHGNGSFVCRVKNSYSQKYMKHSVVSYSYDVPVQNSRIPNTPPNIRPYFENYEYSSNFIWEFQLQPDGFYKIIPLSCSFKFLTYSSVDAKVGIVEDLIDDTQKWIVITLANGKHKIYPKNDASKIFALYTQSVDDGTYCSIKSDTNDTWKLWDFEMFVTSLTNHVYKIFSEEVPTKFFDARDNNAGSECSETAGRDDIVTIYSEITNPQDSNINAQRWKFIFVDGFYEIFPMSKQTYRMTAIITNMYDNDNVNRLRKKYADDSSEQKWIVEEIGTGSGVYRIASKDEPSKGVVLKYQSGFKTFDKEGNLVQLWVYNSTNETKVHFSNVS